MIQNEKNITEPDNIVFLKHGNKYNHDHVNSLYEQLFFYYPNSHFHCYTEFFSGINLGINHIPIPEKNPLRLWWNKLALFSYYFPLIRKSLFFDIDVSVRSDPRKYIRWSPNNDITILNAYWKEDLYFAKHAYDVKINSSIITWIPGTTGYIWNLFNTNRDYYMRKYKGIDRFIEHENIPYELFDDGVVNSVANKEMANAPIDIYNGMDYAVPRTII